jgi:hypothetical protein
VCDFVLDFVTILLVYSSIIKLKALHAYFVSGQALNPNLFGTASRITKWISRMDDLTCLTKIREKPTNVPEKLTSLKNHKTFKELFVVYLRQFQSVAAGMPLSYVIRKNAAVTAEQHLATYPTIDDDLIATASHATPSFCIDNGTVFDLLKPLVIVVRVGLSS